MRRSWRTSRGTCRPAWSRDSRRRPSSTRPTSSIPFGTHIATVEVDIETGQVKILRYVAVDDCGPQINPMIVEGQVHGGIVQGIGEALQEVAVYDDDGQLLTGTMMDYAVPRASQMPHMEIDHTVTPSPVNPLGVKGIGETGTIASGHYRGKCGLRCIGTSRYHPPRQTPHRGARLGRRAAGPRRCAMIPAGFEYVRAKTLAQALSRARPRRTPSCSPAARP